MQISQGCAWYHDSVLSRVSLTHRFIAHTRPSNSDRKALEQDSGGSKLDRRDGGAQLRRLIGELFVCSSELGDKSGG